MTKNKKLVLIGTAAVAVIAVSLTVGITLSYLGKTADKTNTIKVGYGNVEISEEFNEPSEQSMVNENIRKEIYVRNTGTVPSFARVYAEFSDSTIADKAKITYTPKNGNGTSTTVSWADFKATLTEDNTVSDWVYVPEMTNGALGGYFYYTKVLQPKGDSEGDEVGTFSTSKLFDKVTLDYQGYNSEGSVIDSSNIDRIQTVDMIVYSELVQNVETGSTEVTKTVDEGTVTSTVYGYVYPDGEWKKAWKSFLKMMP